MKEVKIKKYKGSFILRFAVVSLCIYFICILFSQQIRISSMKSELENYDYQIAVQEITNEKIRESIDDSVNNQEEFSEEYARSEFDYANPDEKIFVNIGGH